MSRVFVTADWHLGHRAILKYRPEFSSTADHDNTLFTNYKNTIGKRDTVLFLGDICFTADYFGKLRELPGRKILILGNHDMQNDKLLKKEYLSIFDIVHGLFKRKNVWFSHAPIHPDELRGFVNVHGHTHYNNIDDPRYYNACVEQANYTPINLEIIKQKLKDHYA